MCVCVGGASGDCSVPDTVFSLVSLGVTLTSMSGDQTVTVMARAILAAAGEHSPGTGLHSWARTG